MEIAIVISATMLVIVAGLVVTVLLRGARHRRATLDEAGKIEAWKAGNPLYRVPKHK